MDRPPLCVGGRLKGVSWGRMAFVACLLAFPQAAFEFDRFGGCFSSGGGESG